jgi:GTP-binding protein
MSGIVAIIGRPNVGKSTLFNRLIEERKAIVDDRPGVTRDRNHGVCEWNGRRFSVIDTGGYVAETEDVFELGIRKQVEIALEEADVLLFVVDVKTGLTFQDEAVAELLRLRQKEKVVLVANKVDNSERDLLAAEFYTLGFEHQFHISAMSGSGTGDLLDRVVELLPPETEEPLTLDIPKIAIVGRPNVGKSSFVNALLGKEANLVTPIAGTTRDTVYTRYNAFGFDYYLVDTAGLRRTAKMRQAGDPIEFYSTIRTLKAVQECDVALLLISAETGIEAQDLNVLSVVERHRKGLVILVNKWDLLKKEPNADVQMIQAVQERIAPLTGIPIVLTSATEKIRLLKALELAKQVYENRNKRIPTHELNQALLPIIEQTPPASQRGRLIRIKFVTQVEAKSPTFIFFANHPTLVQESYRRFLEKQIRMLYGFEGWPINIFFKEK